MWQTTLVNRLRYYINDLNAETWTNAQLQNFIAIATINVDSVLAQWYSVTLGPYTVDTDVPSIDPDPTTNGAPQGFSNLIVLHAAVIIYNSELKRISKTSGWKIVDDRSTIDTTGAIVSAKAALADTLAAYEQALEDFKSGNQGAGIGIFSTYKSANSADGLNCECE